MLSFKPSTLLQVYRDAFYQYFAWRALAVSLSLGVTLWMEVNFSVLKGKINRTKIKSPKDLLLSAVCQCPRDAELQCSSSLFPRWWAHGVLVGSFFAKRKVWEDGDGNAFFHASDSSSMAYRHVVLHCDDRSIKPLFHALLSVDLFFFTVRKAEIVEKNMVKKSCSTERFWVWIDKIK